MRPVALVKQLDLWIIQIFVRDSFLIEPIQTFDPTNHLWPFVTMGNINHEGFQVIIEMFFKRRSDFLAKGPKIVVLMGSRPFNGKPGSITKLHEDKQNRTTVAIKERVRKCQLTHHVTRTLSKALLVRRQFQRVVNRAFDRVRVFERRMARVVERSFEDCKMGTSSLRSLPAQ